MANDQLPSLGEAHPNPARETVAFTYRLPAGTAKATLVLYDLTGRRVATQTLTEPQGEVQFPVQTLATGLYLGTLEAEGRTLTTRKLSVGH